ncbi:ABC transporter permease [Acidobacteriota bacterium]
MNNAPQYQKPPRAAAWILRRLFPDAGKHSTLGDLTEVFQDLVLERGPGYARLWFWGQILRGLLPACRDLLGSSLSMLKHYVMTARRIIVRNKLYSLINLAGLAVGITCCFLILTWVRYELSFDAYHDNSADLYRILSEFHSPAGDVNTTMTSQAPLAAALKDTYPEVVDAARALRWEMQAGTQSQRFSERIWLVDSKFLDMFSFEYLQGGTHSEALTGLDSIVLTASVARKHFRDLDPIGKVFLVGRGTPFKVTAVIQDLPANSHLDMDCMIPLEFTRRIGWQLDDWGGSNFKTYLQLRAGTDFRTFNHKIREVLNTYAPPTMTTIRLQPLRHIHLYNYRGEGGLITYIYIFAFMAIFVLAIACINYMNLATARSSIREREIGVRKVVGAGRWQLFRQFAGEAFILSLAAGALSVVLIQLSLPFFALLTGRAVAPPTSLEAFALLAGIVILAGTISGCYPAVYLSGVKTVRMLRGTTRSGGNGVWFRRILVVFQFAVSIFLLTASLVVYRQIELLKNSALGYKAEGVICVNMTGAIANSYASLKRELLKIPAVKGMTRTNTVLDAPQSSATSDVISWEGQQADESISMLWVMGVDTDFASAYGIETSRGRFYSEEFPAELRSGMVLNEAAVEAMNIEAPIGKKFHFWDYDGTIIGVVKNFHFNSLHHAIEPLVLKLGFSLNTISLRLSPENLGDTLERVGSVIEENVPNYTFQYVFLDSRLEQLYSNEQRMENISRTITLLAVFVSCLGLLGLAVFSAQQRTKEIGIRKILGSPTSRIILLLTRESTLWVLAANLIAWPLAYIASRTWLQNFAYQTPLRWWMFLVSGTATLAIALVTVSLLAVKTARSNPVESLRHE